MTENDIQILNKQLHPFPQFCEWIDGRPLLLNDNTEIVMDTDAGVDVSALCRRFWQCDPKIRKLSPQREETLPADGYHLAVGMEQIRITADSDGGVRNAFRTLRQLAEPQRGGRILENHTVPQCRIEDFPALPFRAIHLCWFPETELFHLETAIRLAAYCKCNYAILEMFGGFPFLSHPELAWDSSPEKHKELEILLNVAEQEGITLIPAWNLLGHAANSAINSYKHSALSFHPELQVLFEPTGWSWCLTNPEVRTIIRDVVLELYERFRHPRYFHIGGDEAYDIGTCSECRKHDRKTLIASHLNFIRDIFNGTDTRLLMWHDMLLESGDPRWKGYNAGAKPEQNLSLLYQEIPRDIIIVDWEYEFHPEKPGEEPLWPEMDFFKENGFDVIVCSHDIPEITESTGRKARESGLFGYIASTWDKFYSYHVHRILLPGFAAAWGTEQKAEALNFARFHRQVTWDMHILEYTKAGTQNRQAVVR